MVSFENYDKIDITDKGFVEITSGPTGLMLIHKSVFTKLKLEHPHLQIKFPEEKKKDINAEIMGAEETGEDLKEIRHSKTICKGEDIMNWHKSGRKDIKQRLNDRASRTIWI